MGFWERHPDAETEPRLLPKPKTLNPQTRTLGINIGTRGLKASKYESFEGKGKESNRT